MIIRFKMWGYANGINYGLAQNETDIEVDDNFADFVIGMGRATEVEEPEEP